jgi:hypothetical protein
MMMFITTTTTVSAVMFLAAVPPLAAFARPPFTLYRSSQRSIFVNHVANPLLPLRGGADSPARISSSISMGNEIITIQTKPIEGMRPGTSGLRKKVEVWMGPHYVENFIQSLIETAAYANGGKMLDT